MMLFQYFFDFTHTYFITKKFSMTNIPQTPIQKFQQLRNDLLQQLSQISNFALIQPHHHTPNPSTLKIKTQIQQIKQIIQQQEQQLNTQHSPPSCLSKKLEQIKSEYEEVFRERVLPPDVQYKIDKQEQTEIKELIDNITYIVKTSNFLPLLKNKPSTLLISDCRSDDFRYDIQKNEYEEYNKEAERLLENIERIKKELHKMIANEEADNI